MHIEFLRLCRINFMIICENAIHWLHNLRKKEVV
jgi:hypothetical protein